MQVSNQTFIDTSRQVEAAAAPIKQGDIALLQMKERLPNNEAVAVIKGQEVKVQFDEGLPSVSSLMVEIGRVNDKGNLIVKQTISTTSTKSESIDSLMAKAGFDSVKNSDLKQAAQMVMSKDGSITKETLTTLQNFLSSEAGTIEQKLETITALQQKKLTLSSPQLHAVHQTLHGKNVADSLTTLVKDLNLSVDFSSDKYKSVSATEKDILNTLQKALKGEGDFSAIVDKLVRGLEASGMDSGALTKLKSELLKAGQIFQAGADRIAAGNSDGQKLQQIALRQLIQNIGSLNTSSANGDTGGNDVFAEALKLVSKAIQKEPSISKVIEQVKNLVQKESDYDFTRLKDSLSKAISLNNQGREMAARRELGIGVAELETEHPELKIQNQTTLSDAEQYDINQAIQNLNLDSKNIIVTEISKKLSQLAIDFKQIKQDVTKNLRQISSMIQSKQQPASIKQTLEATIAKLDQAILKGDFLLYTDMATEKKLLTASSRLAKAREMLQKGDFPEANDIVKEIKGSIENINFKPSDVRIKHFVSEQSLLKGATSGEILSKQIEQTVKPFPGEEPSARQVFETVKRLGLTHEVDTAQNLIAAKQEQEQNNLKATLMRLLQNEDMQSKTGQTMEQTLANITGQQLLSKHDSTGMQQLVMQLPFLLEKQAENVKIFVNSQKQGETIDWENCSLYFVLETKKMGEVGIMLNSQNSNLSLTFKNDQHDFKEKMEPLAAESLTRLVDIGYHAGAIQFKPFTAKTVDIVREPTGPAKQAKQPSLKQKGYDFTI